MTMFNTFQYYTSGVLVFVASGFPMPRPDRPVHTRTEDLLNHIEWKPTTGQPCLECRRLKVFILWTRSEIANPCKKMRSVTSESIHATRNATKALSYTKRFLLFVVDAYRRHFSEWQSWPQKQASESEVVMARVKKRRQLPGRRTIQCARNMCWKSWRGYLTATSCTYLLKWWCFKLSPTFQYPGSAMSSCPKEGRTCTYSPNTRHRTLQFSTSCFNGVFADSLDYIVWELAGSGGAVGIRSLLGWPGRLWSEVFLAGFSTKCSFSRCPRLTLPGWTTMEPFVRGQFTYVFGSWLTAMISVWAPW